MNLDYMIEDIEKELWELDEEQQELYARIEEANNRKDLVNRIHNHLDKVKDSIEDELEQLQGTSTTHILHYLHDNLGYDYLDDEEEREKIIQQEIDRRKAWLNNQAPIVRIVPTKAGFDLFPYREVVEKKLRFINYKLTDIYLNCAVHVEEGHNYNYWLQDEQILDLFDKLLEVL